MQPTNYNFHNCKKFFLLNFVRTLFQILKSCTTEILKLEMIFAVKAYQQLVQW